MLRLGLLLVSLRVNQVEPSYGWEKSRLLIECLFSHVSVEASKNTTVTLPASAPVRRPTHPSLSPDPLTLVVSYCRSHPTHFIIPFPCYLTLLIPSSHPILLVPSYLSHRTHPILPTPSFPCHRTHPIVPIPSYPSYPTRPIVPISRTHPTVPIPLSPSRRTDPVVPITSYPLDSTRPVLTVPSYPSYPTNPPHATHSITPIPF